MLRSIVFGVTAFALFFAFLWGVVFKHFIVRSAAPWSLLIPAMFFTGIIGMNVMLSVRLALVPVESIAGTLRIRMISTLGLRPTWPSVSLKVSAAPKKNGPLIS